jgi:hypothetical protein
MNGGRFIMSDTPAKSGWRSDYLDCATGGTGGQMGEGRVSSFTSPQFGLTYSYSAFGVCSRLNSFEINLPGISVLAMSGTASQAAEKVDSLRPAPKGASDSDELTVSLKRYPDTRPSFSARCEAVAYPRPIYETRSDHSG